MNQNKSFLFFICVLFIFLCILAACIFCRYANSIFSGDAIAIYAPSIDAEYLTNWHSPGFMLECLALKKILLFLFGINLNGKEILLLVSFLCSCIMWSVGCLQLVQWQRKKILCFMAALVLSFVYFWILVQCHIGLDFFFIMWLSLAVYIVGKSIDSAGEVSKGRVVFNFFFLSFALMQMLVCRRNSLFLTPFLYGFLFYFSLKKRYISLVSTLCLSLVLSGALYLLVGKTPSCVTHITKLYPTAPMMVSDMRISHLLRGVSQKKNLGLNEPNDPMLYASSSCSPLRNGSYSHEAFLPVDERAEADKFANLRSLYFEEWVQHPDSMLSARLIQLFHMWVPMASGRIESLMAVRYPAIHQNYCKIYAPHHKLETMLTTLEHGLMILISLLSFVVCYHFSQVGVNQVQQNKGKILLYSFSALMYAAGYLVVTPTCDARYLNPCFYLSVIAGLYCLSMLSSHRNVGSK